MWAMVCHGNVSLSRAFASASKAMIKRTLKLAAVEKSANQTGQIHK